MIHKSLLVCIAFHYNSERVQYLLKLINTFLYEYDIPVKIIIDTNTHGIDSLNDTDVYVHVHDNLKHPFYLTWQHRAHMKSLMHKYDNFMYVEDDMYVPYENYKNYLLNFNMLYPEYIPSFIRIEELYGEKYVVDVTEKQDKGVIHIGYKDFVQLKQPYHAFWILPRQVLIDTMTPNFVREDQSREGAASYDIWDLKIKPLVELEDGVISNKCYSYHLTNNYVLSDLPFSKIRVNKILV